MYDHLLNTFLCAADTGSFAKAATTLYISPTAVMKQINLLENRLGIPLFTRSPRGLTLTNAGRSYYQDAKNIIQYSNDAAVRAKRIAQSEENVIRIGVSPMTPSNFILSFQPKLQELCPELKLRMVNFDNTPESPIRILRNLGQDIDIVTGFFDSAFLVERQCEGLVLYHLPIRCAVSIHHPLASKEQLRVEDLHGERLMLIKRGWNKYMNRLRDYLQENHPQIELIDFDQFNLTTFNQCADSNSVIVTVDIWNSVHPMLKTLPVDWSYDIPYGILHSPAPSPSVEKFLTVLQQAL